MKSFSEKVYEIVAKIPKGKVATYGQVACLAGSPLAARAVGSLMRNNKDTKRIPCHRVVAADASLRGYAYGGISAKRAKLLAEGVMFKGAYIDLFKSLWKLKNCSNGSFRRRQEVGRETCRGSIFALGYVGISSHRRITSVRVLPALS